MLYSSLNAPCSGYTARYITEAPEAKNMNEYLMNSSLVIGWFSLFLQLIDIQINTPSNTMSALASLCMMEVKTNSHDSVMDALKAIRSSETGTYRVYHCQMKIHLITLSIFMGIFIDSMRCYICDG